MLQRRSRSHNDRQQAAAQRVISRRQLQWYVLWLAASVSRQAGTNSVDRKLWTARELVVVKRVLTNG
jgi:hypothetical protein